MKLLIYPCMVFCLLLQTHIGLSQYIYSDVKTNLAFPVAFTMDDDAKFYVSMKGGAGAVPSAMATVEVIDTNGVTLGQIWDFTDSVETFYERGVLGVELDPDFNSNHYLYTFYNHKSPAKIRIVRFEVQADTGVNPTIILDIDDPNPAGKHSGGNIHFRPGDPDYLYVSIGDRGVEANATDLSNPWGKILRIHKSGSIPNNNPFYDDGDPLNGNDDRIWAYGLRNSFDFTFSFLNDSLYATENGQNTMDEVNQISPAHDYGWPLCEGTVDYTGSCATPGLTAPISTFGSLVSSLPSVTGVIFYDHTLMPEFTNHMLVATFTDGSIRDIELGNAPVYDTTFSSQSITDAQLTSLVDILQGPNGCIYLLSGGFTTAGKIVKMCPDPTSVEYIKFDELLVYPNPAKESIHFDESFQQFKIYNLEGRLVKSAAQVDRSVSIDDLPSGWYALKGLKDQQVFYGSFVKQ